MTGPTPTALYGTDEPVPEAAVFTVGPVEVEVVDGQLRAVRHAGREVLRAVVYVVRDADWGTLAVRREAETVDRSPDRIRIAYQARCTDPSGAVLAFDAEITIRTDGVAFEVTARPEADFTTNRCGFCVLHPVVGVAGTPVEVEHTDGSVERSVFPGLIEPWQPFMDIRAITHTVAPGVTATCRMEGDVFEMEDQRNWSDASYKTYVRPLALPWPYALPAGRPFRQRVAVTVRDDRRRAVPTPTPATVSIELDGPAGTLPRIGLAVTPEETAAVLARVDRLAAVGPQTLLLHFDPTAGHGAAALAGFAGLALRFAGETVLECVVPGRTEPAAELAEIAAAVGKADLRLDAVAVSPAADRQSTPPGSAWPPCPPLEEVYRAARAAFPGAGIGGGMLSNFTELNRKRPPVELLDFVTHCTCPIVHAADDLSVMQSLEALPFIVRSARAIVGDRPYRIGPSTIGMRQNPYGSRTFANPAHRRIPMATEDPRQRGLFAAAWLVGYAAAIAEGGLEALTVGALTGAFGLIDEDGTGAVTLRPLFHAVRGLAALAGCPRLSAQSSHPDRVLAVAANNANGAVIWLANVTDRPQTVQLGGYPTPLVDEIAVLDEHCFVSPLRIFTDMLPTVPNEDGVLILKAYAVARARVRR